MDFKQSMYNYPPGTLMFVQNIKKPIAIGISRITSLQLASHSFVPHHVLAVIGFNTGIEANAFRGIHKCSLHKYIDDPFCMVVVREIKDLKPEWRTEFVSTLLGMQGLGYDYKLLFGLLITKTIGLVLSDKMNEKILDLFDAEDRFVCSEYIIHTGNISAAFGIYEDPRESPAKFFYNSPNLVPLVPSQPSPW